MVRPSNADRPQRVQTVWLDHTLQTTESADRMVRPYTADRPQSADRMVRPSTADRPQRVQTVWLDHTPQTDHRVQTVWLDHPMQTDHRVQTVWLDHPLQTGRCVPFLKTSDICNCVCSRVFKRAGYVTSCPAVSSLHRAVLPALWFPGIRTTPSLPRKSLSKTKSQMLLDGSAGGLRPETL